MMKISSCGAVSLLLLSRIFTLMIYVSEGDFKAVPFLLGICLSTVVQAVLSIILIFFVNKSKENDFLLLITRNKITGILFSVIYGGFFALSGAALLSDFVRFSDELFFNDKGFFFIAVPVVTVAVYGAFMGIKSLSRSASVVFFIFSFMFVATAVLSFEMITPLSADETTLSFSSVFDFALYDISKSPEFVMLPFFCLCSKNIRKDYFSFLSLRLVILSASVFLIKTVLSEFFRFTDFPFFTLVGVSGGFIKSDALCLVVWTLSATLKLSLMIYFCSLFKKKLPIKKVSGFVISGILITLLSLLGTDERQTLVSAVIVILLGGIIPLIFFVKEVFSVDKKTYFGSSHNVSSDRL